MLTPESIIAREAEKCGVTASDVAGQFGSRVVVLARERAYAAIHDELGWSKTAIAVLFRVDRRTVQRSFNRRGVSNASARPVFTASERV